MMIGKVVEHDGDWEDGEPKRNMPKTPKQLKELEEEEERKRAERDDES
jgi:hypothetical protein